MKNGDYVDLYGDAIALAPLDDAERGLVARLRHRARAHPDWCDFNNFAMQAVGAFYDGRGLSRRKATQTAAFRIALDLGSRLGIAEGKIRPPDQPDQRDYRRQLERLVLQFPSRAAFCKAAGISRAMLSHVLAGRKDLSLESLSKALARIGYRLQFVPTAPAKRTG
jgi:hypothetical protein